MANAITYGFLDLQDVYSERVTQDLIPSVDAAITRSVEVHNEVMGALLDLFCERTTDYKRRFKSANNARLQPLAPDGKAIPIKVSGQYETAFPIQRGGTAWGADYDARVKMTVADADRLTNTMLIADARWIRDHILGALFTNVSWAWDDDLRGALTIQALANGDATTYMMLNGADAAATDSHFLAQAAAIADGTANPFPAIVDELTEHPENSGDVVVLVASSLSATIEGLTTFHERVDPNVAVGANSAQLVGAPPLPVAGAFRLLGYESSGAWVYEMRTMPAGYMVGMTTGGDRALAMREEPEPELQGFQAVAEHDHYPFWERQYVRRAGFGANNRVGALVCRVGNASYAVPAGFAAPIP